MAVDSIQELLDVIILGAGFAGLAAGLRLRDAGLRAVVLEARDRPGGRCLSVSAYDEEHPQSGNRALELGGEYIHGEAVRTWHYLQRFGLEACDRGCSPTRGKCVLADGQIYAFVNSRLLTPSEVFSEPNRLFFDSVDAAKHKWIRSGCDPSASVAEVIEKYESDVFGQCPPTDDERRLCHGMLAEWHAADLCDVAVCEDEHTEEFLEAIKNEPSLLADDGEEGHWRVKTGYSSLARKIADQLNILYKYQVTQVDWTREEVHVTARSSGSDHTFRAKHVICALPLACLQKQTLQFYPPLPEEKQQAISRLASGFSFKVILKFSKQFWPEDLHFLFTPFSLHVWWPGPPGSRFLVAYAGGRTAVSEVLEGKDDKEVIQMAFQQVQTIFGMANVSELQEGKVMRWPQDEFSHMGYSYVPVGCSPSLRLDLRKPIADSRLLWAGEACHPTKSASVHGALETGEYAAERAIDASGFCIIDLREDRREFMSTVYETLLRKFFPVEGELDDLGDMIAALELKPNGRDPELHVLVAMHGEDLAACTTYEYYPTGNFGLISYICVVERFRRRGLSHRLMRCIESQLLQRTNGKPIAALFAETHAETVEDGIMDSRIRQDVLFSLGFSCLKFNYTQPPLNDQEQPCGGLRLLVWKQNKLPSQVIVDYLDGFSGSVMNWDETRWKNEKWYTTQLTQISSNSFVEAVQERPW